MIHKRLSGPATRILGKKLFRLFKIALKGALGCVRGLDDLAENLLQFREIPGGPLGLLDNVLLGAVSFHLVKDGFCQCNSRLGVNALQPFLGLIDKLIQAQFARNGYPVLSVRFARFDLHARPGKVLLVSPQKLIDIGLKLGLGPDPVFFLYVAFHENTGGLFGRRRAPGIYPVFLPESLYSGFTPPGCLVGAINLVKSVIGHTGPLLPQTIQFTGGQILAQLYARFRGRRVHLS